ncbi:MAG: MarR family winged helix-turn-helix transcriptional regulator [Lachnospiraceae bacterium]
MDEQLEVALKGGEYKRLLESRFGEIKKTYDLKKVDIEVLFFLSQCKEENTPTDIYKRLRLNRGHISQAIDNLCKRNLIIPVPDESDRRYMHYTVSETATAIIDDIAKIRRDMEKKMFQGITQEELQIYKRISEKIAANIRGMLE